VMWAIPRAAAVACRTGWPTGDDGLMRRSGRTLSITTSFATAVALALTACSVSGAGATSASPSTSPRPSATCSQASKLAQWSTSRLAAQVLVVPTAFTNLSRQKALVKQGIGGLIFFGPSAPRDIGSKISALNKSAGSVAPLYMADEEGGVVQRLQSIVGPVPSARTQAATMSPAQIKALGTRVGRAMAAAHITVDLAPVLDVDRWHSLL
jgi:beta-N-acetylhexosaminidase